ncbi:hypothetical protein ACFSL6_06990 [Paenibacillus thailandensis]|uniref:Uncharacterized protein n=1 Tax=Paenibacillus thailandensis TaxID=393250 RepID=A0ABW5R4X7_9BACL
MNKSAIRIGAAVLLVGAGIWIGTGWNSIIEADTNAATPGSVDDPVVTKSYVDQKIAAITGGSGSGSGSSGTGSGQTEGAASLQVVTLPAGKQLIAAEGAEVIVRSGKAIVYSKDANGIADVTAGVDLTDGQAIPTNHLLWFPRAGRGITTATDFTGSLTVMVRGGYTIK